MASPYQDDGGRADAVASADHILAICFQVNCYKVKTVQLGPPARLLQQA